MKHDRLSILRAQEAVRLAQEKADAFYVKAVGRSTRFRDDPAYAQSVLAFEARQTLPTSPETIGVDRGVPGGDITTYMLGGGGAMTSTGAHLVSGSKAPTAPAKKRGFLIGAKYSDVKYELNRLARLDGQAARDLLTRFGVRKAVDLVFAQYAEFITACAQETDRIQKEMVAPKVEEPKYWVCIKAYGMQYTYQVGDVRESEPMLGLKHHWLPCDKDGWVTHDPQPDSTCPVPDGVKPEAKCRCGTPEPHPSPNSWQLGVPGDRRPSMFDIVAWRPVKS